MFSRSIFVAFLTLALSVQALPQRQQQCPAVSTVIQVRTVTVTATPSLNRNIGGSGQTKTTSSRIPEATPPRQGSKNNNGEAAKSTTSTSSTRRGGNRTTSVATTSPARGKSNSSSGTQTSSVTATTTQRRNGGGGNNNNNGTKTSSSAAATTTAATNNGGNNGNNNGNNNGDPQKSTSLDPRVIAPGFANDGQDVPAAGQVPSLTSTNNFINFCLTVPNLPITNGKQITTGSCNPAPIGVIPSIDNMPSSKFTFPANFGTIKAGQTFTIKMAIKKMQTGFFVNAQANYFAAPQQLNSGGQIQGHSHVVVEQLSAIDQTTPTDPKKFAFFKGLNAAAKGGELTADVPNGLQPGFYKLSSINTAANHQPVIVPVAQHGCLDDAIYFTVTADGQPLTGAGGGKNASPAASPSQPPPTVSSTTSSTVSAKASASAVVKDGAPAKGAPAASTPTPDRGNTNTGNTTGGRGKNNLGDNAGGGGTTPTPSTSSAPAASSTAATRPATKGGRQRRGLSRMT